MLGGYLFDWGKNHKILFLINMTKQELSFDFLNWNRNQNWIYFILKIPWNWIIIHVCV
jgi:hypothetical protein